MHGVGHYASVDVARVSAGFLEDLADDMLSTPEVRPLPSNPIAMKLPTRAVLRTVGFLMLLFPWGCAEVDSDEGPVELEVSDVPVTVDDADLVQVTDLRTDLEGRIWVLTRYPPLVRVYAPDGARQAAFGELGNGPGEFNAAWALVGGGDAGIGVMDNRRWSLRYFAPDGTLRSERAIEGDFSFFPEVRDLYYGDLGWVWAVDGGLLQDRYPPPPPGRPMQMQQAYDFWAAELVFSPDDEGEPRTLVSFSDFAVWDPEEEPAPRPLSAGPLWDLCPGEEFVFHSGAAAELVRLGMDGQVRTRSRVDLPLGSPDVELLTEWMVEVLSGVQPMPGDTPDALRERAGMVAQMAAPHFEPTLPPTRLRCDDGGRVWIQLFDMEHDRRGYAREWVVLDEDGTLLAKVTFPEGFHPMRFEADRVVGVVRDELDVETVGWLPAPALR
jgi:hypothetical protein